LYGVGRTPTPQGLGSQITLAGSNVLLVGRNFQTARTLTEWLRPWKVRCYFAPMCERPENIWTVRPVDLEISHPQGVPIPVDRDRA
jgi:hypothetical protein